MKLSPTAVLAIALIVDCQAFITSCRRGNRISTFVGSSNDAAFSAFADTLEEEPEESIEKSWQAKLEDLLDPQTNLAEVRYPIFLFLVEVNQIC